MSFRSDNGAQVAPEIMNAIIAANINDPGGYGCDRFCLSAQEHIREIFEAPKAHVFFLNTGTAANSIALATLIQSYETIVCHKTAHIEMDECGAPEFYTHGAKLIKVEGCDGKIDKETLVSTIDDIGALGVHNVQKGALSLTNLTEVGSVYSLDEMHELTHVAKNNNMPVHLDGARLANAIVSIGATPAEITWKAGVDIVVLGGTKNGLLGGEAVILFHPDMADEFAFRLKRGGHLYSKGWFFGAQFEAYLKNNRWLDWAECANRQMHKLQNALGEHGYKAHNSVDGNIMFVSLPRSLHKKLMNAGFSYYLEPITQSLEGADEELLSARLVTSWNSSDQNIENFLSLL